jgi:DNA repair protein RecN (Recombination protein N)
MLTNLYIKNYALIDELDVPFDNGLSIITGETGAGKSILLGGLSLVLGRRSDLSQIKTKDQKCVIEAAFDIANYNLKPLFLDLGFDFDEQTIIRREILPSGKSRAFVNDSPVTLDSLSKLSKHLIDIHSQHQTQDLVDDSFQFTVIDALANNNELLNSYKTSLSYYKAAQKALKELVASKSELIKEYDYNTFLFNELNEINLETIDLQDLEHQYETLSNVESIKESLGLIQAMLTAEEHGTNDQIQRLKQEFSQLSNFGKSFEALSDRIESVSIELNDILFEVDTLESNLSTDPKELEAVSDTLKVVNNLLHKHNVTDISDLLSIKDSLSLKIGQTDNLDHLIKEKENELKHLEAELKGIAATISKRRKAIVPKFTKELEEILSELGMPNAKFKVNLNLSEVYKSNGMDDLSMVFTANKGSDFKPLRISASGGELSRIMLAIKSILAAYIQLPSMMFDEIDTGVSGEIAHKMGAIMQDMSNNMQVFTITHLPQIAAKGKAHYKVYKITKSEKTQTKLKRLNEEERLVEVAQMLGGADVTESAMAHARQLLN